MFWLNLNFTKAKMKKHLIKVFLLSAILLWIATILAFYNKSNSKVAIKENKNINNNYQQVANTQQDSLQQKVIQATQSNLPNVFSVVITKNLKYLLDDPFDFYPMMIEQRPTKIGEGSAIYIQDWYFLTNKHVVNDLQADYTLLNQQGNKFEVDGIWQDPILDLAIVHSKWAQLKANNNFVDGSKSIPIGNFVLAIGNALGEYNNTVTFGIISNKWRVLKQNANSSIYIGLYQTDTAINPWNSGGPLVDVNDGKIIWVNTAISTWWEGIGFSIPINKQMVQAMLVSIQQNGKIQHPFLWIAYKPVEEWFLIQKVLEDSVAQKAGLEQWDIITQINGKKLDSTYPLIYYLYQFSPEQSIDLKIKSEDEIKNIEIKLE